MRATPPRRGPSPLPPVYVGGLAFDAKGGPDQTSLSAAERKLADDIVCERIERFNAVNELWEKIIDIQKDLTRNAQPPQHSVQSGVDGPDRPVQPELVALQNTVSLEGSKVFKTLQVLQSSVRDVRDRFSKLETEVSAISAAPSQQPSREASRDAEAQSNDQARMQLREAQLREAQLNLRESQDNLRALQGRQPNVASAQSPWALAPLTERVDTLEELVRRQGEAAASARQELAEAKLTLSLDAMKSCRMFLRVSDLTREQREAALQSMQDKERSLHAALVAEQQQHRQNSRR